jgi:hypothetical protein
MQPEIGDGPVFCARIFQHLFFSCRKKVKGRQRFSPLAASQCRVLSSSAGDLNKA